MKQRRIQHSWLPIIVFMLCVPCGAVRAANGDDEVAAFECIGSYGETVQSFERYSHYVFLNQGFTLRGLDIRDPARPREILWRLNRKIHSLTVKWPALWW